MIKKFHVIKWLIFNHYHPYAAPASGRLPQFLGLQTFAENFIFLPQILWRISFEKIKRHHVVGEIELLECFLPITIFQVSKICPYAHYFKSGIIGSGTCIFSCTPIHDVHFQPYSLNGYAHKVTGKKSIINTITK